MTTITKLPPDHNIVSKLDATGSAAGNVKLDFIPREVTDLYIAFKRFNKRFSNISQDITDPVRPLAPKLPPTHFAVILPRPKLTATNLSLRFLWKWRSFIAL